MYVDPRPSFGGNSGEIDIVVLNRESLMPLLFSERDGIFPIEACLYAIEVQSSLESRKLQQLKKCPNTNQYEPVGTLLAFGDQIATDRDAILQRYDLVDSQSPPLVRVGCVSGSSYWYFSLHESTWRIFDDDHNHNAVVRVLGGLANTITNNDWSPVRRGPLQRGKPLDSVGFGHYIIPEGVSRCVPRAIPLDGQDEK